MQREHQIAFKLPDVVPFLDALQVLYPDIRVVVMRRGPVDTLNSLLAKRWFAPENETANLVWPFRVREGVQVPFWVAEEDVALWARLSEVDRCAYYYLRMNEGIGDAPNRLLIDYECLDEDPSATAAFLADQFGLSFGEKTPEIIQSIHRRDVSRDTGILDTVSPEYRKRILAL
jgi:hypothetical protein